ncbi:hypothetical protein N658DRAFT_510324 [Parathielavia hyrcaniae]|uniref:Uncharacterized protein n=1 Tax=Parathielavia hyrcaniae TaxID=113614 RepID=A0AAN6SYI4_9PEZI|nr:hypothetical protein N658DRAFT_510324 [Parathielavia hyrcaniae]
MSLSQSSDLSSSTLGAPRVETPPMHPLSHSPPKTEEVELYENRELHLVPMTTKRGSVASALSKEIDVAFAPQEATATAEPPATPGEGPKLASIRGVPNVPTFKTTTPTGHNPEKKIQKLTGLGDTPEAKKQRMRILKEQQKHLHGEEISPVSISSSDRGSEGLRTAVSDLDGNTEADGRECSPRKAQSQPRAATVEVAHAQRLFSATQALASGRERARKPQTTSRYTHQNARHSHKANTLAAAQHCQEEGRAGSADCDNSLRGTQLPPLPHRLLHSPDVRPWSGSIAHIQPVWRPSKHSQEYTRATSANTFGHVPRLFPNHASPQPVPESKFDFDSDGDNDDTTGTSGTGASIPISIASDISGSASPGGPTAATQRRHRRRRRHSSSIMAKVFRRVSASASASSPAATATPPPVPNNTPQQASSSTPSPPRPPRTHPYHSPRHGQSSTPPTSSHHHHHQQEEGVRSPLQNFNSNSKSISKFKPKPSLSASASALAAKTTDLLNAILNHHHHHHHHHHKGGGSGISSSNNSNSNSNSNNSSSNTGGGLGLHLYLSMLSSGEDRRRQRLKSSIRVLGHGGQRQRQTDKQVRRGASWLITAQARGQSVGQPWAPGGPGRKGRWVEGKVVVTVKEE